MENGRLPYDSTDWIRGCTSSCNNSERRIRMPNKAKLIVCSAFYRGDWFFYLLRVLQPVYLATNALMKNTDSKHFGESTWLWVFRSEYCSFAADQCRHWAKTMTFKGTPVTVLLSCWLCDEIHLNTLDEQPWMTHCQKPHNHKLKLLIRSEMWYNVIILLSHYIIMLIYQLRV